MHMNQYFSQSRPWVFPRFCRVPYLTVEIMSRPQKQRDGEQGLRCSNEDQILSWQETGLGQILTARFLSRLHPGLCPCQDQYRSQRQAFNCILHGSSPYQSKADGEPLEGVTGNDLQKNYPGDSNDGLSCIPRDSWKAS